MKIKELRNNDLLYQDVELRIESIKSKKNLYLVLYRISKILVFMAGASITIVTGWQGDGQSNVKAENFVLITSASIALFAAIEGLFSFKDKGKSYDIFLFDLRRLRDKICFDFMKSPELYNENKQAHFEEFQKILQSQKSIIENSDGGEE